MEKENSTTFISISSYFFASSESVQEISSSTRLWFIFVLFLYV